MSSIAQLVSEIAHSVKQPDSVPVRRAIKLAIIHGRNQAIERSYSNRNYTDKVLQQRFKLSLVDVPDGDLYDTDDLDLVTIKRTATKVPRPTRIADALPFHSVRTVGVKSSLEIPFVREASSRFYASLPGMCPTLTYDYINEYIYINIPEDSTLNDLGAIVVESVFEYPHLIPTETSDGTYDGTPLNLDDIDDNNEFLLPEDLIGLVKQFAMESWNGFLNTNVIRDTNENPSTSVVA